MVAVVEAAVRNVLVLGDVDDVAVDVFVAVIVVDDADVLVSEDVVDDIVVVVIELVVEDTVVLVADVVVAVVAVVEVEDVVGQAPSPGMQLDGPAHTFPFLFCGTTTS